jgi:hypothetical protein
MNSRKRLGPTPKATERKGRPLLLKESEAEVLEVRSQYPQTFGMPTFRSPLHH